MRPKDKGRAESRAEHKREQILRAAADLLLERGYAGVSVDEVVARAGGSKTNVYTYFGGKDGLFAAVMQRFCDEIVGPLKAIDVRGLALRDALIRIGTTFLGILLEHRALEVHRLAVAEAHRHPDAARAFFNAAPEETYAAIAALIAVQQVEGRLRAGDPRRLAAIFLDSLTGDAQLRALTGMATIDGDERARLIETAADIFLEGTRAHHGATDPGAT
jgi:TetR/AcrR family transcriptional regulator, mexJK operon transcriptional repressor